MRVRDWPPQRQLLAAPRWRASLCCGGVAHRDKRASRGLAACFGTPPWRLLPIRNAIEAAIAANPSHVGSVGGFGRGSAGRAAPRPTLRGRQASVDGLATSPLALLFYSAANTPRAGLASLR